MITWVTVWFMVVSSHNDQFTSKSYSIPYAAQEICLRQAKRINNNSGGWEKAECKFGQLPVVTK